MVMALTKPSMGWNTWNTFGANINETLVREMADLMVSEGYLAAGYRVRVYGCGYGKSMAKDG